MNRQLHHRPSTNEVSCDLRFLFFLSAYIYECVHFTFVVYYYFPLVILFPSVSFCSCCLSLCCFFEIVFLFWAWIDRMTRTVNIDIFRQMTDFPPPYRKSVTARPKRVTEYSGPNEFDLTWLTSTGRSFSWLLILIEFIECSIWKTHHSPCIRSNGAMKWNWTPK